MNRDELPEPFRQKPDLPASPSFQDEVMKRVTRHARVSRWTRHGLACGLTALCAFFIGQQLAFQRDGSRRARTPRVASADNGVQWLLENQAENGSWDLSAAGGNDRFTTGVTSLAVLAVMKSPEQVPRDGVQRALSFLEATLDPDTLFSREGPDFYNAMMTLYTLQEANRLYPDPDRRERLNHTLATLIRNQHPSGGWGYLTDSPFRYRETSTPNSAVTWWTVQLLRRTGPLPGKDQALENASAWLEQRFQDPAHPEYRAGLAPPFSRGNALMWMAISFTHEMPPHHEAGSVPDAYRDFLRSQVEQPGAFLAQLQESQQPDGSWVLPDDRWWNAGGQVYVTALRVLAQVPRES
jgi:hypothetical protein